MFARVHQAISKSVSMWLGLIVVASLFTLIANVPSGASLAAQSSLRCGSDRLTVIWRGTTGGLAGTFGDLFWIRNKGASPCVISGFPSVALYEKGKRLPMKTHDLDGHKFNDQMGVTPGRRIPSIRLQSGGIASFWVFGNDVAPKCIYGDELTVSLKSLTGISSVPVPNDYQSWIYCGVRVEVNPLVPGASGSDPSRPLASEIMR
jgi:hypothetical protein